MSRRACPLIVVSALPLLSLVACMPEPRHACRTTDDCLPGRVCNAGTCQSRPAAMGDEASDAGTLGDAPGAGVDAFANGTDGDVLPAGVDPPPARQAQDAVEDDSASADRDAPLTDPAGDAPTDQPSDARNGSLDAPVLVSRDDAPADPISGTGGSAATDGATSTGGMVGTDAAIEALIGTGGIIGTGGAGTGGITGAGGVSSGGTTATGGAGGMGGGTAETRAIYNGVLAEDYGPVGVGQLVVLGSHCSATVYSRHWAITAAHCFPASLDANKDGSISWYEVTGDYFVRFLMIDHAGTIGSLDVFVAMKHPASGGWGTSGGVDMAMLYLGPDTDGVAMEFVNRSQYDNGRLRLYQGATSALEGEMVLAFGWGIDRAVSDELKMYRAWKYITSFTAWPGSSAGAYQGGLFNNAGTSCSGDFGGPDLYLTDSVFYLAGIHNFGNCANVDGNTAAEAFRDFAQEWGSKCWVNGQGWTDWNACN